MTNAGTGTDKLLSDFREEYNSAESVRRYTAKTAGVGVSYLLEHDYGEIYLDVVQRFLSPVALENGLSLWEFGCGGGMNLIHLVSVLHSRGIPIKRAYGTDLSESLIEAAQREANSYLPPELRKRVQFCVAVNEHLVEGAAAGFGVAAETLVGSFEFIIGVNTIRYCHRLRTENNCAEGIRGLLSPGGVCVVIDMNDRFPAFRSRLRDRLTKEPAALAIPSLDGYARPFADAGFEILRKEHFCWIPHSAGKALTATMRALSPLLDAVCRSRAMRSLVVARKPAA